LPKIAPVRRRSLGRGVCDESAKVEEGEGDVEDEDEKKNDDGKLGGSAGGLRGVLGGFGAVQGGGCAGGVCGDDFGLLFAQLVQPQVRLQHLIITMPIKV
jgi:hypothetical protein